VTPCSLVSRYKLLRGNCSFHIHALLMERILPKCCHLCTKFHCATC